MRGDLLTAFLPGSLQSTNRFVANLFPSSTAGSRILFDYKVREASVLRNGIDVAIDLATLLEVDPPYCCNRQEIRVILVTGSYCFR